jgi:predicted transcriptional regulator
VSDENDLQPVELATEITIAWLNNPNNRVAADEVPSFLRAMHSTLTELAAGGSNLPSPAEEKTEEEYVPAVTARRSLASKDHILSMIDGKPYKTLTRHLSTNGLTPDEYRRRYKLKADYPMVAETYAAHRRELAKRIGLGRRPTSAVTAPVETPIAAAPAPQPEVAAEPVVKAAPVPKPARAKATPKKGKAVRSPKAPASPRKNAAESGTQLTEATPPVARRTRGKAADKVEAAE